MKKIRYLIEALFLWLCLNLFRSLKPETASDFGGWIGRTIGPKLAATRKAERNLRAAMPELTESDITHLVVGMWDNLGRTMAEYPHLSYIVQNCITVDGLEQLAHIDNSPAVFIGMHSANWEVFPFFFNHQLKKKSSSVFRAPNNPYAAKLLDQCRLRADGLQYIPKTAQGVRDMVRVLKDNQWLGYLIDQKFKKGVPSPFFGRIAMTSDSFAQLAHKFRCPIIPLQIVRTQGCNFHLRIHTPLEQAGDDIQTTVDRANALLESWIRQNPGQWLWLHRRWDHKS